MDTIGNFGIAQIEDDMEQKIFTLDADRSNSMKSANPNSGIHESNVAKTLDTTTPTPQKAQGGQMIVAYDARGNGDGKTANTITGDHANRVTDFTPICVHGSQDPISNTEHANAVNRNNGLENCICQYGESAGTLTERHDSSPCPDRGQNVIASHLSVRRLLPVECERLMGFPDNWTKIPWRGKPADECPDAPRYKACGNSMGVNCMRWIGLGIEAVEAKHRK